MDNVININGTEVEGTQVTDERIVMWDMQNAKPDTPYSGGYYFRSDLKDFVERIQSQGNKVVGIVIDDTYNLELIVQEEEWANHFCMELNYIISLIFQEMEYLTHGISF